MRPIKPVSLFFSHNTSGDTMPGSLQAGNPALSSTANPPYKPSNGSQNEFGVKTSFFKDTLTFSLAHFDIGRPIYAVPEQREYYVLRGFRAIKRRPICRLTSTFLDVNSKGWEAEGSYSVNKKPHAYRQSFVLPISPAHWRQLRSAGSDLGCFCRLSFHRWHPEWLWRGNSGGRFQVRHGGRKRHGTHHDQAIGGV